MTAPERFAQLTYTSFDAPGTAGGWQVKQVLGRITEPEQRLLVANVHTTLNPVGGVPTYPSPEQIAELPRRLCYRPVESGAGYWHTVAAGTDSTGRPGNVFAHVLLDRTPAPTAIRPIERWRSADWLTPYGPAAVGAAVLPAREPGVGTAITAQTVLDFACATDVWRLGTLCVLLDAVLAAMRTNSTVVLGAASPDTAARWIGLVSYLMSAGTAARFGFSTFDRATELSQRAEHLIAVPESDLDAITERDLVLIGESEPVSLGELGGQPHRTARGRDVPVTEWSVMAQVALIDPVEAAVLLDAIDDVASRVDDDGLHPALPMAMAVLAREEFADAAAEARAVIAEWAPPQLAASPEVGQLVADEVSRRAGVSTEDAARAACAATGGLAQALTAVYLTRACADTDWLDRPAALPVPACRLEVDTLEPAVRTELSVRLASLRGAGPARLLRAVDLLGSVGLGALTGPVLDADLAGLLADPERGPELIARLPGPVGSGVRRALAQRLFGKSDGGVPRLHPRVLDWLAEACERPTVVAAAAAEPGHPVWIAAVVHALRALGTGSDALGDRQLAYWWLARRGAGADRLEPIAGTEPWEPAALLAAVGPRGPFPGAVTAATLLTATAGPDTAELAGRVIGAGADDRAVACAAVWGLSPAEWIGNGYLGSHFAAYTPFWDTEAAALGPALGRDFVARLLLIAVLAATAGARPPALLASAQIDPMLTAETAYQVEQLVASGTIEADGVLAAVLLSAENGHSEPGVGPVLGALGPRLSDRADPEAVAAAVARITGDNDLRRCRRLVSKNLSGTNGSR